MEPKSPPPVLPPNAGVVFVLELAPNALDEPNPVEELALLPKIPPPVVFVLVDPNGDAPVLVVAAPAPAPPPNGELLVVVLEPNPPKPDDAPPPNISIFNWLCE